MAVKKKIDRSVDTFIDKGADVKRAKDNTFKNVLIRIPTRILSDVDSLLEESPWICRTHFIIDAIRDKLANEHAK